MAYDPLPSAALTPQPEPRPRATSGTGFVGGLMMGGRRGPADALSRRPSASRFDLDSMSPLEAILERLCIRFCDLGEELMDGDAAGAPAGSGADAPPP